jgi:hypothetical protein
MERSWLAQYPAGVPAEIDINRYPSVVALIEENLTGYKKPKYIEFRDDLPHQCRKNPAPRIARRGGQEHEQTRLMALAN